MSVAPIAMSNVPVEKRGKLYWFFADSATMTKRHMIQTLRIPDLLVFSTIQPVMFVLLFRYVFGGAIATGSESYVDFLMAGIFVQTIAFGSVSAGIGLAEDLQKGIVDRFRSLPISTASVLLGRTIADLFRNLFTVIIMLIVGILVGFRPDAGPLGWLGAFGLMMLFSYSMSWVSMLIGISVKSVEAAQQAGFIWLFPLTFASSAFVPVESMPSWLQTFAEHQPITVVVDSVRAMFLDQPLGTTGWQALAWCIALLAIFVPLSVRKYRTRTAH